MLLQCGCVVVLSPNFYAPDVPARDLIFKREICCPRRDKASLLHHLTTSAFFPYSFYAHTDPLP